MGQAVDTVYRDLEAVLRTLQSLEKEDTVACGLLTKMHKPKFIGCIYIFQHVLPILNLHEKQIFYLFLLFELLLLNFIVVM